MTEILVQFDEPQWSHDGHSYIAQVCGQLATDGLWEGWVEFIPTDGQDPIRTARETEQFTQGDLRYWAFHLNREYLEGALTRALTHTQTPTYATHRPASFGVWGDMAGTVFERHNLTEVAPVLDPFALYRQSGVHALRRELRSLDARQLQDIVAAYEIPKLEISDTQRTFEDAIAEQIVADVQHRVGSNRLEERNNRVQSQ